MFRTDLLSVIRSLNTVFTTIGIFYTGYVDCLVARSVLTSLADSQHNSLTPWSRVILEKIIGSAASQEIPRIFGTRRFLTVLTSARHLSLS